nr:MAG TPA: hypothetical protein [Caudoviricetes sp.]
MLVWLSMARQLSWTARCLWQCKKAARLTFT